MCFEANLGSIDFDELDQRYRSLNSNTQTTNFFFHEALFSLSNRAAGSIRSVTVMENPSLMNCRIQRIAWNQGVKPMGNVSGEAGLSVSWGGDKGTEVSGYASGSISDDKGNKVEVNIEVKSDGSGNASASASHEEKTGS